MEPPCEHGGMFPGETRGAPFEDASMEPPCEHGGMSGPGAFRRKKVLASMEPPCEHGGMFRSKGTIAHLLGSFNGAAV